MRLFAKKELPVKLDFSACGKILINGLRFSFSVESSGKESSKGLCVSFSGAAIDSGEVTFSQLEYLENKNGKIIPHKADMPLSVIRQAAVIHAAKILSVH